jgi:hypothetical protein
LRKEFQRIQENNKSAFENEKPLNLKRVIQPQPISARSESGVRIRPEQANYGAGPSSPIIKQNNPARISGKIKKFNKNTCNFYSLSTATKCSTSNFTL